MHIHEIAAVTDELAAALADLVGQLDPTVECPSRSQLSAIAGSSSSLLLGASSEAGGPIVGMLTLVWYAVPTGTHAWIEDVVVDEAARGQGVGTALVEAAVRHARMVGAAHVDLTSRPSREAANRLYQRLGFERRETNVYRFRIVMG